MMSNSVAVIGAGFAGLSAAAHLSSTGYKVHLFEKNSEPGGRARSFSSDGFTFDMGPSWYWMPEIFEKFYKRFGHTTSDYYDLQRLDPAFRVIFPGNEVIDIPADFEELCELVESMETGAAAALRKFMTQAEYKYRAAMDDLALRHALSPVDLLRVARKALGKRIGLLQSYRKHVRHYFKDPRITALLEFPALFLGATPSNTPALYSMMSYAGLKLGTWYPKGGMAAVPNAFSMLNDELGVHLHLSEPVASVSVSGNRAGAVTTANDSYAIDGVVAAADYNYVENNLLPEPYRNYRDGYWNKRTMAPSCLLFFLGVSGRLKLSHHNLFFDKDLDAHAEEIYNTEQWPSDPLFYVCCPSVTDATVAPDNCENLFVLMPIASGIEDPHEIRERYYGLLLARLEKHLGENIRARVIYKRSYCVSDFESDYNAYRGNAYGLANTLRQTANLKPRMKNKQLQNLVYAGQLTVPGPGVPPAIISGQIAAQLLINQIDET